MKFPFILLSVCLFFPDHGGSAIEIDGVSVFVMEGDSVTLLTGIKKNQENRIRWYCNDTRIAQISGDPSKTCTNVQCNEGTERFRDRLKLDHQTGSLTITNITSTDSGVYQLKLFSSNSISEKTFSVSVHGVSAAEREKMKRKSVKEGESVTLDPGVIKQPNHVMTWYFNDALIAEITGDPNKTCTDFHCHERFRDRLQLDHQSGSLTIRSIRITDSGVYELKISSSLLRRRRSISRVKSFDVTVINSGLSPGTVAGLSVIVLLMVTAAIAVGVIFYRRESSRDGHVSVPTQQD
ncbi:carcinoembryonic antigen-related cell adhesion molecule 1-like [Labeo rohita]|uniref:carcinoembryonic antigen-related cell adhesion molecule 1-like n=1 Tax=Labeo rohita TaxID=84645 RepID=UPI0021E1FA36|nr:carcinoembryonic antigen-related cell adhesion molecule 1-like [Labeo rohita]